MLTSDQASVLLDMIEAGCDGNWPHVRDDLLGKGYSPEEVVDASNALCEIAGRSPIVDEGDF